MAKQSGLGDNLYIGGVNVSNDTGAIKKISGGPKPWENTGIDKLAPERIGLARDGGMDFTSYFNPTVAHPVWSALPTADVIATYVRGTTLGNPAACMVAKQINYDPTRAADGALTCDISMLANGFGLEWGVQLTAGQRTDTTATSPATGVDQTTVSTSFGWQAWLHVFAGFAGTSVTVTLQDSADNSSFANFGGGGGAFTAATGITSQRIASPGATDTVRRYVRAITSGVFTNAVFAVVFTRNLTATSF
jgi:hypothetical protein